MISEYNNKHVVKSRFNNISSTCLTCSNIIIREIPGEVMDIQCSCSDIRIDIHPTMANKFGYIHKSKELIKKVANHPHYCRNFINKCYDVEDLINLYLMWRSGVVL